MIEAILQQELLILRYMHAVQINGSKFHQFLGLVSIRRAGQMLDTELNEKKEHLLSILLMAQV